LSLACCSERKTEWISKTRTWAKSGAEGEGRSDRQRRWKLASSIPPLAAPL
jgi:hypothetical protein